MIATGGTVTVNDCRFFGNVATNGGAVYIDNSTKIDLDHCLFQGNQASDSGGAVFSDPGAYVTLNNCTISHNRAMYGGGIYMRDSVFKINSTIISFSAQGEAVGMIGTAVVAISFSDIYGNAGGNWIGDLAGWYGILGNICEDPMYVDPYDKDFRLEIGSPCIDTGDPDLPGDPDGTITDMGALYFDQLTAVGDGLAAAHRLAFRVHGNPASHTPLVAFSLARSRQVALEIFDLRGYLVASVFSGSLPAGPQQLVLDVGGLPSGLYFCRLRADELVAVQKLAFVK